MRRPTSTLTAVICASVIGVAASGCSSTTTETAAPAPSSSATASVTAEPIATEAAQPALTSASGIRTPDLEECFVAFDEDLKGVEVRGESFITEEQALDAWKQATCFPAVVWAPTFLSNDMFTPEQALALVSPYMTANAIAKFTPQYEKYSDFMSLGKKLDKEDKLGEWTFDGDEELLRDYGQAASFIQPWFDALGEPTIDDFRYRNPGFVAVSGDKETPRVNVYVEHIAKAPADFDPDRAFRWIGNYTLVPNPEPTPEFAAWLIEDYTAVIQTVSWDEAVSELS